MFIMKPKRNGSIERYKVKLVAKFLHKHMKLFCFCFCIFVFIYEKRLQQTHEVYYQETFALVDKMNSIRILLSIIAFVEWTLL